MKTTRRRQWTEGVLQSPPEEAPQHNVSVRGPGPVHGGRRIQHSGDEGAERVNFSPISCRPVSPPFAHWLSRFDPLNTSPAAVSLLLLLLQLCALPSFSATRRLLGSHGQKFLEREGRLKCAKFRRVLCVLFVEIAELFCECICVCVCVCVCCALLLHWTLFWLSFGFVFCCCCFFWLE